MRGSPPWRTDDWDLGGDLAKIAQQWAAIRQVLEDPALFERGDPDVSGWSCGGHAGHSILVAKTIADRVEGNLAEPDRHRDEVTPDLATRVLTTGGFKRGVAESPPDALPGERTRDDFLALLAPTVAAWERVGDRAGELPACPARARHFALGYLTSTEWVRMCAVHTAHHLGVVRDIAGEEWLEPQR